jgi:hypothetical protein
MRAAAEAHLRIEPENGLMHMYLGIACAYLGRQPPRRRPPPRERGMALLVGSLLWNYAMSQLVRIQPIVGDREHAIGTLETLVRAPSQAVT